MRRLEHFSEPFSKTGNIAADGYKRLMGCPTQDLLQTLLRESIQNSIDATVGKCGPSLLIRVRTLTHDQRKVLRDYALADLPLDRQVLGDIDKVLEQEKIKVLEVCDFNTSGLGGPTSGNVAPGVDEVLSFVNFFRNVGVAKDNHHGGGTYGYGKTSLYAMSSCATILVDTQATYRNKPVRRFMGAHLGSVFDAETKYKEHRRFTGRHWWGVSDGDDGIDPLTGAQAANLGQLLGMPYRDEESPGTSILVLAPHLEEGADARCIGDYIQEIVMLNFWPRLTQTTPIQKKLVVKIEIEGQQISLPAPEEFPPFDLFASAMAGFRSGTDVEVISSASPKKKLGSLVIKRGLRADRCGSALSRHTAIPSQASHIALMRPVELVVKYIEGVPYADAGFEWAGVFVCSDSDEVESAFAMSEPPAHDDWVPNNLSSRNAKIYVKGALRRLSIAASNYSAPINMVASGAGETGPSLANTAARLGRLLDGVSARGPGKATLPRTSYGRKSLSLSNPRFICLEVNESEERCAIFESELRNDGSDEHLKISITPHLVADGAPIDAKDLPPGYETKLLNLSFNGIKRAHDTMEAEIGIESGIVRMSISSLPNAAVGVKIRFMDRELK
ncbi:hypothetical protein KDX30_26135 [Pseudomonas sp. CDFA 553]|uniref:hypothetical protein n=1 Tax=Pseudomonas quasicaspiana TaxID=2829821 RepID=UPI001E5E3707|nr:hypothetical protein [Pseudomonas quasicaspiana]MCD5991365.1 hypothetical protein [Pseudomonas quasicaspiana]